MKKAQQFSESENRARYVAAAQSFRMPYWDWAIIVPAGQSVVPTSMSSQQILVIAPGSDGKQTSINNPLYSFRFHPVNPSDGDFPDNQVCIICTIENPQSLKISSITALSWVPSPMKISNAPIGRYMESDCSLAEEWYIRVAGCVDCE